MPDIKLSYFDFDGGRGEDCRLALHIAGVAFTDDRVSRAAWRDMKASMPFGVVPVLEVDGRQLAQSNAILAFIGRAYGMHPSDPWEAARHEALMMAVEELRSGVNAVLREKDPDKRRAVREEAAAGLLQTWGAQLDAQITGPFVGGEALNVVDLKLFVLMKWFISGGVDHIPPTVFDRFAKLRGVFNAVRDHEGVRSWYAMRAKA